jgi:hypothetical protein
VFPHSPGPNAAATARPVAGRGSRKPRRVDRAAARPDAAAQGWYSSQRFTIRSNESSVCAPALRRVSRPGTASRCGSVDLVDRAEPLRQRHACACWLLAQNERQVPRLARRNLDDDLQRGARSRPALHLPGEVPRQRRRTRHRKRPMNSVRSQVDDRAGSVQWRRQPAGQTPGCRRCAPAGHRLPHRPRSDEPGSPALGGPSTTT